MPDWPCVCKMKSYGKALASLQSVLERVGSDAAYRVYDSLGKIYQDLSRKDEAEAVYYKADDKRRKSKRASKSVHRSPGMVRKWDMAGTLVLA